MYSRESEQNIFISLFINGCTNSFNNDITWHWIFLSSRPNRNYSQQNSAINKLNKLKFQLPLQIENLINNPNTQACRHTFIYLKQSNKTISITHQLCINRSVQNLIKETINANICKEWLSKATHPATNTPIPGSNFLIFQIHYNVKKLTGECVRIGSASSRIRYSTCPLNFAPSLPCTGYGRPRG